MFASMLLFLQVQRKLLVTLKELQYNTASHLEWHREYYEFQHSSVIAPFGIGLILTVKYYAFLQTANEFKDRYSASLKDYYFETTAYFAYDAIWALAFAINR